jgi:hypothetical protein
MMSGTRESDCKMPGDSESFEERIDMLFEELSFAIQWQRPSILLAFHGSKRSREMAELALQNRLAKIGQRVVQFKVDERHFDIPLLLSQRHDRDRSVYFVTSLFQGGGKDGANAYRALNIRREYFVDYAIRVILWLSRGEVVELSRHAPDLWAFRHRVVEFYESSAPQALAISANEIPRHIQRFPGRSRHVDEQINQREAILGQLPKQVEFYSRRQDLLSGLAGLYLEKRAYDQAIRRLKQGIAIARQANDVACVAKFLSQQGDIYLDLDQPARAIRAYWKAVRLNPQDASSWTGLQQAYLLQGRVESARNVYKKASKAKGLDKNT